MKKYFGIAMMFIAITSVKAMADISFSLKGHVVTLDADGLTIDGGDLQAYCNGSFSIGIGSTEKSVTATVTRDDGRECLNFEIKDYGRLLIFWGNGLAHVKVCNDRVISEGEFINPTRPQDQQATIDAINLLMCDPNSDDFRLDQILDRPRM